MGLPLQYSKLLEAGTDEAGRGCLAGPVTAAAVILPPDFSHPLLNDSKKLSEKQRFGLRPIIEKEALAFAVAHCSIKEIDQLNILHASIKAMHKAIRLYPFVQHLLQLTEIDFTPMKTSRISVSLKEMDVFKILLQLLF